MYKFFIVNFIGLDIFVFCYNDLEEDRKVFVSFLFSVIILVV